MTKSLSILYLIISTITSSSSFNINPKSAVRKFHQSEQIYLSYRDPRLNNMDDTNDIEPPVRFDPRQFDDFDGGGWSTNVNNPYVAARYVKFRRAAQVSNDEDVTQELRDSMEMKATEARTKAWEEARMEEREAERKMLERLQRRDDEKNNARMNAWKKAREEEENW